jgi:hypothetical protein
MIRSSELRSAPDYLFALDRQSVRADIDMQPFGLVTVLIELVSQDRDGDDQRAEDQIKRVAAIHNQSP